MPRSAAELRRLFRHFGRFGRDFDPCRHDPAFRRAFGLTFRHAQCRVTPPIVPVKSLAYDKEKGVATENTNGRGKRKAAKPSGLGGNLRKRERSRFLLRWALRTGLHQFVSTVAQRANEFRNANEWVRVISEGEFVWVGDGQQGGEGAELLKYF